jgi:hypothetical protein
MFLPYKRNGIEPFYRQMPAEAITPKVGLCLQLDATSGQLQVAGADVPTHICMENRDAAVSAGELIYVEPIHKDIEYESTLDGDNASLTVGTLADIDSTGLLVDADASTDDVFRITEIDGLTSGSKVRGYFVK